MTPDKAEALMIMSAEDKADSAPSVELTAQQAMRLQRESGKARQKSMAERHVPPRAVRRAAAITVRPGKQGRRARRVLTRVSKKTGIGYRVTRAEPGDKREAGE